MKKAVGILTLALFAISLTIVSCSKEEWTDTDNFVEKTYREMRDGALGGHFKCYKAVFPLSIVFPDGSIVEVNDREELISTLKSWREDNPDAEERPTLEFPIEIVKHNGDTITVEDQAQLKELRQACAKRMHAHRACRKIARFFNNRCYEMELPVTVVFEDGEMIEIAERKDIKDLLKAWKDNRPDDVPELIWPVSLTLKESGDTVEVNSFEEIEAILEECGE